MELTSEIIEEIISMYPEKVKEYNEGKTALLGLFLGETMKKTRGKADPKTASYILKLRLEKGTILTEEEMVSARNKIREKV